MPTPEALRLAYSLRDLPEPDRFHPETGGPLFLVLRSYDGAPIFLGPTAEVQGSAVVGDLYRLCGYRFCGRMIHRRYGVDVVRQSLRTRGSFPRFCQHTDCRDLAAAVATLAAKGLAVLPAADLERLEVEGLDASEGRHFLAAETARAEAAEAEAARHLANLRHAARYGAVVGPRGFAD
jgi:hypothetical protein